MRSATRAVYQNRHTLSRPNRLGSWKSTCVNTALLLLAVIFSFSIAEAFLRVLGYHGDTSLRVENTIPVNDTVINWRHKPNSAFYFNNIVYSINERGFRDYVYSYGKPPRTFRIFLSSDSIGFGTNVSMNENYPKILERRLNALDTTQHFQVINYSMPGLSLRQKFHLVTSYAHQYSPDLIIIDYALNDIEFDSRRDAVWERTCRIPFVNFRLPCALADYLKQSAAIVFLRQSLETALQKANREDYNHFYQQVHEDYFHRLYTVPTSIDLLHTLFRQLGDYQRTHRIQILVPIFPLIYDYHEYKWDDLNDLIINLCEEHNLHYVSLLDTYRRFDYNEMRVQRGDFTHPSVKGNVLAAESIIRIMREQHLLTKD